MKSTYISFIIFLFLYFFPQAQSVEKEIDFDKDQMDKIISSSGENNFMGNISLFENGNQIYNIYD